MAWPSRDPRGDAHLDLKRLIRDVPDFPEPGILFKDITPLLQDPVAFRHVIEVMADHYKGRNLDTVVGIEARGFLFGAPLAIRLGLPFVPIRKKGKRPPDTAAVADAR